MHSPKYPRTYHFPFSPGTTSDDRILHNWEQILQHPLVMTEKLDGENTCLKASGVYARSHAAPTRNPWARNMLGVWERLKNDLGELEIFGENLYGIHSIEYERLPAHFFIFAIREQDHWLAWEEVVFYAKLVDLPVVPVVQQRHFTVDAIQACIQQGMKQGSAFGGDCEGYVFRNAHGFPSSEFSQNVIKYVRKNHVKTDEHWTRNWKRAKLWFERTDATSSGRLGYY